MFLGLSCLGLTDRTIYLVLNLYFRKPINYPRNTWREPRFKRELNGQIQFSREFPDASYGPETYILFFTIYG